MPGRPLPFDMRESMEEREDRGERKAKVSCRSTKETTWRREGRTCPARYIVQCNSIVLVAPLRIISKLEKCWLHPCISPKSLSFICLCRPCSTPGLISYLLQVHAFELYRLGKHFRISLIVKQDAELDELRY
jgi:hypothetical protein